MTPHNPRDWSAALVASIRRGCVYMLLAALAVVIVLAWLAAR